MFSCWGQESYKTFQHLAADVSPYKMQTDEKRQYLKSSYLFDNEFLVVHIVKLLPLPQPPVRARTDPWTNPSAQRATQLRSVIARMYAVSKQNQITTTVP
jgi:hypothetical protein